MSESGRKYQHPEPRPVDRERNPIIGAIWAIVGAATIAGIMFGIYAAGMAMLAGAGIGESLP